MNILFGDPSKFTDKYTALELDTFKSPTTNEIMTAYCVLEMIPLSEMQTASNWLQIHADLIQAYRQRHWNYCKQAIEGLTGKWNGELDTFYQHLLERVVEYEKNPPDESWDGYIVKELNSSTL